MRELATRAGSDPCWLSRLLAADRAIRDQDRRILRLGRLVGLPPEQVFTEGRVMEGASNKPTK
jgi:hypothetical protein